ncbi:LLGL scribble cell polarity complex component 2-like [Balaenoptera musculus]|uniref:LLGL scribble cell polarity complex component 2-like n=1 Tax=Balaenoptera musculus TaxID=9771 RepID=A0A8B8WC20_BALMU|nr:LLGL scribble cell polarity complex component 2-like [Balaenoptera musculus]
MVLGCPSSISLPGRLPFWFFCVRFASSQASLDRPLERRRMRRLPQDLAQAPNTQGGQAVLVASEEQFKVFSPPKMSAKTKFKLTAHEGCRVRKVALATFASVACGDYAETCLACLTNLGDVVVFPVPDACSAHSFSSARGLRCAASSSTQWPVASPSDNLFLHLLVRPLRSLP